MNNKILFTICYVIALITVLAYKVLIHEEPWAIGLSQVITLWSIMTFAYITALNFAKVRTTVIQFFTETGSPLNLAFFRIIFFGFLFLTIGGKQALWFSQFPKELQFAPMGMGWLLPHLPINLTTVSAALFAFKLFCFLTMIGCLTRFSSIMAALTGFYLLGVPQFYGSVSHNHHVVWFLTIFAASRCGDSLSVDAVIKGFKRADRNDVTVSVPSTTYTLPLRFMWILMGLCYFFPGFWKLWNSGTAWILGDNLRNHMYLDWLGFDQWLPVVRIDHLTWLCRLSGAIVILFEASFLFLIFSPSLRYFAFFQGLFFHNMTNLLMNINFYVLQICYVSFLNWEAIFQWCGKKLFPNPMTVLFDGSCSFCRRAIAFMRVFDIFGRIEYFDLFGEQAKPLRESFKLSQDALMTDMHAVIGTQVYKGFGAYQKIALRIPLLWPLCPFLPLNFVQALGDNIYRNVADHRACRLMPKAAVTAQAPKMSNRILIATSMILISGNVIFGFMGRGSGWPFACYPTFSEIAGEHLRTIDCQVINEDGTEQTFHLQSLKSFTGSYKIVGLVSKIFSIKNETIRNEKFKALWKVLSLSDPNLKHARTVRFYFLMNYIDPAKWHLNPIEKTIAFEFQVNQ